MEAEFITGGMHSLPLRGEPDLLWDEDARQAMLACRWLARAALPVN